MFVFSQDETLLFSSLNVIENADHTFDTKFQDHQYKVGLAVVVAIVLTVVGQVTDAANN